jgi:putative cardiolipin synthase
VQDRSPAIVGSFNQDPRSQLHNTEAWIAIDSPELAGDLAALFGEASNMNHAFKVGMNPPTGSGALEWLTEEGGKSVRYDVEPMTELWLRAWRDLLDALIPEHML